MTAPADISRPSGISDRYGPLLHLSDRDRSGLQWLKCRSRQWVNHLKRRRRYSVPRRAHYSPEESALIEALTGLEREAGRLLEMAAPLF